MAAVGGLGPIGAFAAPVSVPVAAPGPSSTTLAASVPSVSNTASVATLTQAQGTSAPGSPLSGSTPAGSGGLGELEALAILALLSGRHRNHGADPLSAMVIAMALQAYAGVQGLAPGTAAVSAPRGGATSVSA